MALTIPIENVYYLLCYAWDKLTERDIVDVDPTKSTELVDLFARVLRNGLSHLLKRGLDRGYVLHGEETARLRGKLEFAPTVKRNLLTKVQVYCSYDELSHDVLHNRILKTTLARLIRTAGLDAGTHDNLVEHHRRLHDVREVELTKNTFRKVQLHRNNSFYFLLLAVCELLFDNLLPSERSGRWVFRSFLQDDRQMAYLFETFIRNFYRSEGWQVLGMGRYQVKSEDIRWNLRAMDPTTYRLLPEMKTDVSIDTERRKILIECKYYRETFQEYWGKKSFRSHHLYQLNAYLDNLPDDPRNNSCHGILLYPQTEQPVSECIPWKREQMLSVRTIDLNQPWPGIERDLLTMLQEANEATQQPVN